MNKYAVTIEVDYVIEATSLSEALSIASEHTEHPIIGQGESSYCDDVRVIGGKLEREGK